MTTGGAGFIGARLARALLARGTLAGQPLRQRVLADQALPPSDLCADARVQLRTGPLLAACEALREEAFDGVFHLALPVSGECETDFDLGLRSKLDSTRALLDALRHWAGRGVRSQPRGLRQAHRAEPAGPAARGQLRRHHPPVHG